MFRSFPSGGSFTSPSVFSFGLFFMSSIINLEERDVVNDRRQKSPGENHKEGEEKDGEERDQEKTKIVTHFSPPDGSFNGLPPMATKHKTQRLGHRGKTRH